MGHGNGTMKIALQLTVEVLMAAAAAAHTAALAV